MPKRLQLNDSNALLDVGEPPRDLRNNSRAPPDALQEAPEPPRIPQAAPKRPPRRPKTASPTSTQARPALKPGSTRHILAAKAPQWVIKGGITTPFG